MREGGGVIDLPKADDPKLFSAPADLSFGLVRRGRSASRLVALADAGGGAGAWTAAVAQQSQDAGVTVTVPASVTVPGTLTVRAAVGPRAAERELTGFVVLTRGAVRRRIPYWFRVEAPRLAGEAHRVLRRPGTYRDDARRGASRIVSYRYPDDPSALGLPTRLRGPEVVYRVRIRKPVANFGVAVIDQSSGSRVAPRVVAAGDENRLVGQPGLPVDLNPYLESFQHPDPVAGALLPSPGTYDVVFDTPSRSHAGRFRFRFWISDTTPPSVRLLRRASGPLVLRVTDRGSGVDPLSLVIQYRPRVLLGAALYDPSSGLALFPIPRSAPPVRRGVFRGAALAQDNQEAKNVDQIGANVLPNTTIKRANLRGTTRPTVTWLLPLGTSCVKGRTVLAVAASAPAKIRAIRFFDGKHLIRTVRRGTVGLYTATWRTRAAKRGPHRLRVVVVSRRGSAQARRNVRVCR